MGSIHHYLKLFQKSNNLNLENLKLKYPLIVKPVNEGSSIGIFRALQFK